MIKTGKKLLDLVSILTSKMVLPSLTLKGDSQAKEQASHLQTLTE
jgi:hypothetical protein